MRLRAEVEGYSINPHTVGAIHTHRASVILSEGDEITVVEGYSNKSHTVGTGVLDCPLRHPLRKTLALSHRRGDSRIARAFPCLLDKGIKASKKMREGKAFAKAFPS